MYLFNEYHKKSYSLSCTIFKSTAPIKKHSSEVAASAIDDKPVVLGGTGWSVRGLDRVKLAIYISSKAQFALTGLLSIAEAAVTSLERFLVGTCRVSMPRKSLFQRRRAVHWWTSEITTLRRLCVAAQRAYQRTGRRVRADDRSAEAALFRITRKTLFIAIKRSQEKCWAELCARVEHNPWDLPYRIVAKSLSRANPGSISQEHENELMSHLFPSSPTMLVDRLSVLLGPALSDEAVLEFTMSELNAAEFIGV